MVGAFFLCTRKATLPCGQVARGVLVVPTAHRMHTMPTTVGVARDMAGTRYGRGDRTRQSISQGGAWSGFRCHTRHLRETRAPVLVRVCACVFY
jgi:hypothetical protein